MSKPIHDCLLEDETFRDMWADPSASYEDIVSVFKLEYPTCDIDIEVALAMNTLDS